MDEGYIKFELHWQKENAAADWDLTDLQTSRQLMYQHGFIGWDDVLKVGFGNISKRLQTQSAAFIISGTQTGGLSYLERKHFCLVDDFDIPANQLWCKGPIKASSESMTHAAIYETSPKYQAVIHIHHRQMCEYYYDQLPTTKPSATYGTPEMAAAISALIKEGEMPHTQTIIMGGHQDGIIAFGTNLKQVSESILKQFQAMH